MQIETAQRKLNAAQRDEYGHNGFVIVENVFPVEELARIDGEVDSILERNDSSAEDRYNLLRLGLRSGLMGRLAADPRLLALLEDLVHPGIAIYSSKMVAKIPRSNHVCHWHQDDAYCVAHSWSKTRMSIWLGLHDSDASNGGMWFIPRAATRAACADQPPSKSRGPAASASIRPRPSWRSPSVHR